MIDTETGEIKTKETPIPNIVDQSMKNPGGTLNQNGLFYNAIKARIESKKNIKLVKIYEKLHPGIWVYNGIFKLIDAWQ
jgi:hypothetical protein